MGVNSSQGPIYRLLADDHVQLDRLLDEAAPRDPARVNPAPYDAFRRGLLKHIGMAEKVLPPAAQQLNGGQPVPVAARLDHGAIPALLAPGPTPRIVAALKTILTAHHALEEGGRRSVRGVRSAGAGSNRRAPAAPAQRPRSPGGESQHADPQA